MGFFQRRLLTGVLAIASHPIRTLVVVGITLAACGLWAGTSLNISTDQNQLFSDKVPFFRNYLDFIARFPENEAIYLILEPRDPTMHPALNRWTAAADAITDRLRQIPQFVDAAECRVPLDQLGRQGILFLDRSKLPLELEQTQQFAQLAQFWGQSPGAAALLGGTPLERTLAGATARDDDATAGFVGSLAHSWNQALQNKSLQMTVGEGVIDLQRANATDPAQLGYFYTTDETDPSRYRILIRVYPTDKHDSLTAVTQTVDAIRNAAVQAAAAFPEFTLGVTGRPALEADQMRATDSDSHHAEIAAVIVVFIGMAIMLRSIWLALAAEIALGAGIGWTFGWATGSVGELNLLSLVFLIALIGIGMDYLVQILVRYRLEVRRYQRPQAVWVRVFKHVGPPINTACLGAAGAFLASIFTDFRGAANLGVIAGGGLILCLIAGYTVLPALLTIFPPRLKPFDAQKRYTKKRHFGGAGRLLLPIAWLAALAIGGRYMTRTYFDPGLIQLQVPKLQSVRLIRTLQTWSAVVLSKDVDQLSQVRDAVANLPAVKNTQSVLDATDNYHWLLAHANELPTIDWAAPAPIEAKDLPGIALKARKLAAHFLGKNAPAASDAKKTAAAELSHFADSCESFSGSDAAWAAGRLSLWQNVFVGELQDLLSQFHPQPLNIAAVPAELRRHLLSEDGFYALYIYPKADLWNGQNLQAFVTQVEAAVSAVPNAPPVTGIAIDIERTTGSIHVAFYRATIYALILIFCLVLLDFRRLAPTLAAISVLGLGLPMLLSLMGLLGISWNFANFFGLPILIGAGHEYGVFMVHRYLEARKYPERVWRRWDASDRALLLCAFITSSSFGFFWLLATHQGLKSLGLVMALGTACIYLAALTVLRPILRWKLDSIHRREMAQSPQPIETAR
jgi:uncharacterized protein